MDHTNIESLDVIAVGAHPDDVEIAIGGTLAKLVQEGVRVGIVDLTNGEPTPNCSDPKIRLAEAQEAASILGVQTRITLDLPNRALFDCYEARVKLATVFRKYKPKLVLGMQGRTPMASPDHWQAMQITDAGIFYSRLTKWDDQFSEYPPHTVEKQVWYPLTLTSPAVTPHLNRFVLDISGTFGLKLKAIKAYQTQFPPEKAGLFSRLENYNRSLGNDAGFDIGEMFFVHGELGVKNFMNTVFPK